jgi:RHS repeat-associated protein
VARVRGTLQAWCAVVFSVASAPCWGQITSLAGDGVLNAPYRGTIDSLREATMDVAYGEVKTHVEPSGGSLQITGANVTLWAVGGWDRSVLRLYEGVDASASEIDLSNGAVKSVPVDTGGTYRIKRFSLKAIATKTLAVQAFTVHFQYNIGKALIDTEKTFKVAPLAASGDRRFDEREAFLYGVPLLDVAVGNARLTIPTGRTALTAGLAFTDQIISLFPGTTIGTSDAVLPGAGGSTFLPPSTHFRLQGSIDGPYKSAFGTPWPGFRVGYYILAGVRTPDGTCLDTPTSSSSTLFRIERIRPLGVADTAAARQVYNYDNAVNNRVISIQDGLSPTPNVITLNRNAGTGYVQSISTSDGRSWTIQSDGSGRITGIVPASGKGARYFKYVNSADPALMYRVTQVRLGAGDGGSASDPDLGDQILYKFVYDGAGDLREEWRYVDGQLRKVIEHVVIDEGHRQRKEWFGAGAGDCRVTDFTYDTGAGLKHRLASVTSYSGSNGTGTAYVTTYTHDVNNARGNMVITQVTLPDNTTLTHEYNAQWNPQVPSPPAMNAGIRTRTTHSGGTDGSLVTYDVNYEFFYPLGTTRLFYSPRLVKQRDGLGHEVVLDYENGYDDQNGDGLNGEQSNQLMSRTGPTINQGTSGPRSPATRFYYDLTNHALARQETDTASGLYREITYAYDSLLRLITQTVDPTGEILVTRSLYCDTASTQARSTVDADGYWTRTEYDNDGRVASVKRYLNQNAGNLAQPCTAPTGPYYETQYVYDTDGRLFEARSDNKDQAGNPIAGATHPIVTRTTYDRLGQPTLQVLDPGGINQESNFVYNWLGDVTQQFDTSGRGVLRTYDGRGLVETETPLVYDGSDDGTPDPNLTTTFQYDAMARRTFTYPPTHPVAGGPGEYTEQVYDDFGRLESLKRHPGTDGGNLITTTTTYDAANHVTRTLVEEAGVGALSDATALYDEGGFKYEARQRTTAGADSAADPVTQWKFDWAGSPTEERGLGDATVGDRVVTTHYDTAGRVHDVTDSTGGQTVFTRDDRGHVTQQDVQLTASTWAVTNTQYDALGRVNVITDPTDAFGLRHYRVHDYDSRGHLLRETATTSTGTAKQTSLAAYDAAGRQTRSVVLADAAAVGTLPQNAVVTSNRVVDLEYDADGRLRFRRMYNNHSATARTTETTYDPLGRVNVVTDASGSTTDDDYFANGRLQQRVLFDPGLPLQTTTFDYDGHDRTSAQTAVGTPSLTTLFGLDGLDRPVLVTSPKGIQTRTQYDLAGRRAGTVEDYAGALARETVFAYNRLSQLIQQTAKNATWGGTPLADQVTTYRYDPLGRPTRAVYPDAAAGQHADPAACTDCLRTTVDLAGRPDGQTDPRGTVFDFDYDARGLLLARTTSGSERDSFAYDALRRLTAAQRGTVGDPDAVAAAALDYTDLGDVAFETQTLAGGTPRTVDYAYDQAGNRLGLTYPGGATLAYTPTAVNQVDTIDLQGSPLLADYAYYGRLLNTRAVTTDAAGGGTIYTVQTGYDAYRRVNALTNTLTTPGKLGGPGLQTWGSDSDGWPTSSGGGGREDSRRVAWSSSPQASAAMQGATANTSGARAVETLAAYTFTHDADGHPLTQTADGLPDFAGDDRTFTVDRLARLTDTAYAASGTTESSTFDRVGNREDHTNRAGQLTDYSLANAANEYGTISSNGTPRTVAYDAAGNLTVDEAGRQYTYDAYDRLTQVRAGAVVLANYTYDALGRRAVFEDPVRGTTVRYTYDGSNVIEERDAADALVRYHVNGAQFADERIATFTATVPGQPAGTFTYYLGGNNFSVVGTGNADGSTLTRLDYSATGDFAGGGGPGTWYAHDADDDGDVDAEDFADFQLCFGTTDAGCRSVHDVDIDGVADGHIDLADYESFWGCCGGPGVSPGLTEGHDWEPDGDVDLADWAEFQVCFGTATPACLAAFDLDASGQSNGVINLADAQGFERRMNGPNQPPGGACPVLGARWAARATPPSGTFALHGRAIDVLADGLVLQDFRNRVYAPQHGRWLQRDPTGYSDGPDLYEAFGNNATANTDPTGEGILTWLMGGYFSLSDAELIRENTYHLVIDPPYGFFEGAGQTVSGGATEFGRIFTGESAAQQKLVRLVEGEYGIGRATADEANVVVLRAVRQGVVDFFGASNVATGITGDVVVYGDGGTVFIARANGFERVQSTIGGIGQFAGSVGGLGGGGLSQATQLQMARFSLQAAARIAPASRTTQVFALRAGLAIERSQFALETAAAAEFGAAEVWLSGAGTRPSQMATNIVAGQAAEVGARAMAIAQGETILETQFRQGAVLRGIDFASFVEGPEGVQLFLKEVKGTPGLVSPGRFTSLGLGRGGRQVFEKNLGYVQRAIEAQVADEALRAALQRALPSAEVRLVGPSGFGVTGQTIARIQGVTGRPVVVVIMP